MPKRATAAVQIVHFNDVYNINETPQEPSGGAARFVHAIRSAVVSYPGPSIVAFSGDAFSPAPLTPITKGSEIPPILNACGVHIACVGNHEFDQGIPIMRQRVAETNFPWLLSNVTERASALPMGCVSDLFVMERANVRFGFMGLASKDWLVTLDKVDLDEIDYVDFVTAADHFSALLRDEHQCHFIIALTHMRQPDDERLAREAKDIDLILGGHDHVLTKKFINGTYVVKSGTDFKNYSTIQLDVDTDFHLYAREPVHHNVTSDIPKDPVIAKMVAEKLQLLGTSRWQVLVRCAKELDGRFVSIRTSETGLGNLVSDILASSMGAPIGLINSGSFRSDSIEPPGDINQHLIDTILPFHDEVMVVEISGESLLEILENSVSQYPILDGRFLQVSGISFSFDPRKPPHQRLQLDSVEVSDENGSKNPVNKDRSYRCAMKTFIFSGKDGFPAGDPDLILQRSELTIQSMVLRHLERFRDEAGEERVPEISPGVEGRIICAFPDEELLHAYKVTQR